MIVKLLCNDPDDQEFLFNAIQASTDYQATMLNDSAGHTDTQYYVVIEERES